MIAGEIRLKIYDIRTDVEAREMGIGPTDPNRFYEAVTSSDIKL